jgi:4-hydroxy-tetrahydrodipicolinate synthase
MVATPFDERGQIDEDAFRAHLRRLIAARIGIYLPSGGAGEAHVLSLDEMLRLCQIGVEEARGKVPVHAGCRESRSAADMYAIAAQAVTAGVDTVQLYQVDNGHGMIPTQREQEAYWSTLLDEIDHPVAISIHHDAKFKATPAFLRDLCGRYEQVSIINLVGSPPAYFMELRDLIPGSVRFYAALPDAVQFAALGADGAINPMANLFPHTVQSVADAYGDADLERLAEACKHVQRFLNVARHWAPSTARWVKLGMNVLGLGNGVLRPPYLLPGEEDQQRMAAMFDEAGLPAYEAKATARAAERTGR